MWRIVFIVAGIILVPVIMVWLHLRLQERPPEQPKQEEES